MHSILRVLIFLALITIVASPGFSQDAQDPKEQARQYMEVAEIMINETKAIDDARGILVLAADLDTTFIKANWEAGRIHLMTIGKDLAVKYLLRVYRQDPAYRFDIEFAIGESYQYGLQFDKAVDFYNRYKEKLKKKSNYQGKDKVELAEVERKIFECANGKEYVSKPGNYSIVNIGREINSEFEDYAPVLTENEDEIVFTSRRREDNLNENVDEDNKPFEDIFISYKKGSSWERAKNIGQPVNTPYHGSNLALSADGSTLFIYKDDNGGDIYYSEKTGDNWGEPIPLPGIINSSFEEKSITISKDEKTLYFTSDRPGGYGGIDIYRATLDSKGQWSNVKNLGNVVNTEFDDDGPFIDYDGVTLYFSSRGHKGMGGHDIFKTIFNPSNNTWSEPENLGYPINTPDDDIFFVSSKDGKRAYYSSVREDGLGYTDIFVITIPEGLKNTEPVADRTPVETPKDTVSAVVTNPVDTTPVDTTPVVVTPKVEPKKQIQPIRYIVKVVDATTKEPVDAKVKMQGAKDNVVLGLNNKGGGVYEFNITSPTAKDYRLSVEMEGYAFENQVIRVQGATETEKTINKTVEMRKLVVRVSSVLRNIYFDFDKATFKEASYPELNLLERMMSQNQNLMVEIAGHTDNVGAKAYNLYLSKKRAEAVKDYLTKKGIDGRRINAVGYGETKPLASNDDEAEGREYNRRVEFIVLGNK